MARLTVATPSSSRRGGEARIGRGGETALPGRTCLPRRRMRRMRWTMPAARLMLAACSGGQDEETGPEASSDIGPLQKAERPAPAETPAADAETEAPAKAGPGNAAVDGKTIPPAIRGRWALKAADCAAKRGTDPTALTIDATNLPFFESPGDRERGLSGKSVSVRL